MQMTAFHEILFPLDIALNSAGGPERRTEIVALGSGREERNARWAHSRRRYDAGYGVKTLRGAVAVVAFFEERRGQLHGFRWRDRLDHSSAAPGVAVSPLDQAIGIGDGETASFALKKTYGGAFAPYARPIAKPVAGSVRGRGRWRRGGRGRDFTCDVDDRCGDVSRRTCAGRRARRSPRDFCSTCRCGSTPIISKSISSAFAAGAIPKIPLVEIECDVTRASLPGRCREARAGEVPVRSAATPHPAGLA